MADERDRDRPAGDDPRYWSEAERTERVGDDPTQQEPGGWNWGNPTGDEQGANAWPGWGEQPAEPTQRQEPAPGGWAVPGSGAQGDPGAASGWGSPGPQPQGQPGTAWAPPGQGTWAPPPGQEQGQGTWAPPPGQEQGQGTWAPPPGQEQGQGTWAPPPGQGPGSWAPPPGQGPGAWPPPGGQGYGAPPGPPRRSRAWLFVVIPLVLIVGGLAVVGLLTRADRDESGSITEGGTVGVFDLAVGDCLQSSIPGEEAEEIREIEAVPCSEPHYQEVYAVFDVPAGEDEPYPGDTDMDQQANDGCVERFEGFVGQSYEESIYYIYTISPRSGTWSQGDREVVCSAYEPDELLAPGSIEGSGE